MRASNDRIIAPWVAACLMLLGIAGCGAESSKEFLSAFFDGVGAPPPKQRVRRDFEREIRDLEEELEKTKQQLAAAKQASKAGPGREKLPVELAQNWAQAAEILPKDQGGHVDWAQAIEAGTIAPRPSFDPDKPEQAVLDLDLELNTSGNKLFAAVYPHAPHTRWLACQNCHPAIFPLRQQGPPAAITMAKIEEGRYCGVCHGKVAFAAEGRCARCHAKIPAKGDWRRPEQVKVEIERAETWEEAAKLLPVTAGTTDWAKALAQGIVAPRPGIDPQAQEQPLLPLDVERVPAAGPMFKAVFPHQAHTAWLGCPNCHTAIFQMAKGATPITMEKINAGQACGVCHGKVAFPATACGRCHPAMAGG